jgi:hypothetical protein
LVELAARQAKHAVTALCLGSITIERFELPAVFGGVIEVAKAKVDKDTSAKDCQDWDWGTGTGVRDWGQA